MNTDTKQGKESALDDLKACLRYCREVNGREDCKNCGLDEGMIERLEKEITLAVEGERERVKGILRDYFKGLVAIPAPELTLENIVSRINPN